MVFIGGGAGRCGAGSGLSPAWLRRVEDLEDSCGCSVARSHLRQKRCAQILKPRASRTSTAVQRAQCDGTDGPITVEAASGTYIGDVLLVAADGFPGSAALSRATSQTDARRGELPLIGSLGVWRSTRLRFALSGPYGG